MASTVHIHLAPADLEDKLDTIVKLLKELKMNEAQMLARLSALDTALGSVADDVTKIGTETDGLQVDIAALRAQLANAGAISPAIEAALASVEARLGSVASAVAAVDAKVPDTALPGGVAP